MKLTDVELTEPTEATIKSSWLAIPFDALYAEARQVQDRISLLRLAKEYHIGKQNFEEASKYREAEKALKADVEKAVNTIGATLMANHVSPTPA